MEPPDETVSRHTSPVALQSDGDNITSHDDSSSDSWCSILTDTEQLEEAIRNNRCNELEGLLDSRDDLLEAPLAYEFTENYKTVTLKVAPLALAAALGKTSIVKLLIEYNANVNAEIPVIGGTALHLAARYGPKDSVDLLLSKQADINQRDQDGSSPLHLASRYDNSGIAACLLDAQADLSQRDDNGNTPFLVASMWGQLETLKLLWERGSKEQINETNRFFYGPLHLACLNGTRDTAEWLLDIGAAIDKSGWTGATPLHLACEKGHIEIITVLHSRFANLHKRDDRSNTPILHSCLWAQPESLDILVRCGSNLSDVDDRGRTCFHNAVWCNQGFLDMLKDVFQILLGRGANINQSDNLGYSPLYIACMWQEFKHVECLLDLGADIDQKGSLDGVTALMMACSRPDTQIVKMLLQRGADMTSKDQHRQTALQIACNSGWLENVKALIENGADVKNYDREGYTPLLTAVIQGNIDIALEILATPVYFPQNPAEEKAFTQRMTSMEDVSIIEDELLKSVGNVTYEEQEQLQTILHWAIANGALELARCCVSHNPQVLQWKRSGATWLHVAAQYGQHEFIRVLRPITDTSVTAVGNTHFHEIDVSAIAEGNITALHVAAVNGSVETAQLLLQMISKQSQKVAAIIQRNSRDESPLTISISQRYKDLEAIFWETINQLGSTNKDFMQSDPKEAGRILELLAKYEKPGHEVVLKLLLQQWFQDKQVGQQDFTALHWAVHHSQAVVVWWLLSKGGYSSGYVFESALKLVPDKYEDTDVRSHIRSLLLHPPPMLPQVANPNDDRITLPPTPVNEEGPALKIEGNIVDIYSNGEMVSIPYTKSSIRGIIYEQGPDSLMKEARENLDLRDLDALKRKLNQDVHDQDKNGITGDLKLRWVHLPVNELHLMRDLLCRLSPDSKRSEMDHTALMKHFNRSWTELAAGGKRNYMKPQCVRKEVDPTDHPKDDLGGSGLFGECITCTALYMPYLTLGNYAFSDSKRSTDGFDGLEESAHSRNSRQIRHKPMTLDQFYYPTITDTVERDNDQVLSKFLDRENKQGERKVLMVNQLWIWIIDQNTIITATAEDTDQKSSRNLLQTTLNNILYGETRSRFERATSVQSVMELILRVATGSFVEKFIPSPGPDSKRSIEMKGPIEIFRESIRNVADDETRLFRDFLAGLRSEEKSWLNSHVGQISRNRYYVISSETELLEKIRDICDELHILRALAEDQDTVWKQAFSPDELRDQLQYNHSCTPTDVKKELDELLLEAEKTTTYINDLLDLRQAEYSRMQANDSAKLSNSIFVFTLITIVFLPLSFLSSLFALDISSFPHESGELKYEAKWLFPILFGVTAAVSIPAILLAWNVNVISEQLRPRTKGGSIERSTAVDARSDGATRSFGKILKRRWRGPDKNVLPRHEGP